MSNDNWYYTMGGQQQGPAPLEHLKHWLANGQLQPAELVWREGMPNWIAASAVPELQGIAPPAGVAAAGFQPQGTSFAQAQALGYQTMVPGAMDPAVAAQVSKAKSAMICGIIGLLCFGIILGPIAIVQASTAMGSMKRTGSEAGKGMATAGMVLGIIDVCFFAIYLVLRFAVR